MSKKVEDVEVVMEVDGKVVDMPETETSKQVKNNQDNKKNKKKKKEKVVKSNKAKEMVSELKKVTWPSFTTVLVKTGVVLLVVLFFFAVLFGIDYLMSLLYKLLTKTM